MALLLMFPRAIRKALARLGYCAGVALRGAPPKSIMALRLSQKFHVFRKQSTPERSAIRPTVAQAPQVANDPITIRHG